MKKAIHYVLLVGSLILLMLCIIFGVYFIFVNVNNICNEEANNQKIFEQLDDIVENIEKKGLPLEKVKSEEIEVSISIDELNERYVVSLSKDERNVNVFFDSEGSFISAEKEEHTIDDYAGKIFLVVVVMIFAVIFFGFYILLQLSYIQEIMEEDSRSKQAKIELQNNEKKLEE